MKKSSLSHCQSENQPWVDVAFGQQLDADFQKQSGDGQVQVLLTSCRTAVATDATGEVRGGDRQTERGIFPSLTCIPQGTPRLNVARFKRTYFKSMTDFSYDRLPRC